MTPTLTLPLTSSDTLSSHKYHRIILRGSSYKDMKSTYSHTTASGSGPDSYPQPDPSSYPTTQSQHNMPTPQHKPSTLDPMAPTLHPETKLEELHPLLYSLAKLARDSYTTRKSKFIITADYMRICSKTAAFFTKADGFDFVQDGTFDVCLEMQSLAQLIELNVRCNSEFKFKCISWPISGLEEEEEKVLKRVVQQKVDGLVWGRAKINNMKTTTKAKTSEEGGSDKEDSGYSSADN